MPQGLVEIGVMALQASVVAALLGLLYRVRDRMGLLPLAVAAGALQYLQVVLLRAVYVELAAGLEVSPGSAILFTATVFTILLVHLSEEAERTRDFVYALVLSYLAAVVLSALFGLTFTSTAVRNPFGLPAELLMGDLLSRAVGVLALVAVAACAVAAYEALQRLAARPQSRLLLAASAAIVLDEAIFTVVGRARDAPLEPSRIALDMVARGTVAAAYAWTAARFVEALRPPGAAVASGAAGRDASSAADDSADLPQRQPRSLRVGELLRLLAFRDVYAPGRGGAQNRDPLTKLLHRGFFDAALPLEIERSHRAGTPLSLLLLDLDHFKSINDRHGHAAGDEVLKKVGAALREAVRSGDAACRIGGEEFAVIAPHAGSGAALQLAQRIRARLDARLASTRSRLGIDRVTVTIGAAAFPADAASAAELFRVADERLYEGKRSGRDRVIGAGVVPRLAPAEPTGTARDSAGG
jgi:diguanylate cyclase (GGDEF)-like protein